MAVAAVAACWQRSCSSGGGGGQRIHSTMEVIINDRGRHCAATVALKTLAATAMAGAQTTISKLRQGRRQRQVAAIVFVSIVIVIAFIIAVSVAVAVALLVDC